MKLEFEVYYALCAMSKFIINDIQAEYEDFGDKDDIDKEHAEDYCCGDMQFTRKESTPEILAKYNITQAEYNEICDKLTEGLSFGTCGWCS